MKYIINILRVQINVESYVHIFPSYMPFFFFVDLYFLFFFQVFVFDLPFFTLFFLVVYSSVGIRRNVEKY
jgi:hypothetical protein